MRIQAPRTSLTLQLICTATLIISLLALSAPALAQTETVLFNFPDIGNASEPDGGVAFDTAGNLYGTAEFAGRSGNGAVFQLKPKSGGGWTEKAIHTFGSNNSYAFGGVVFDSVGNLYGTTTYGGAFKNGVVFELTPKSNGTWTEKNVHVFGSGKDGQIPEGPLIFDSAGNLYGVTFGGGTHNAGIVFELVPNGSGSFNEKIIHNFGGGTDGQTPFPGLIIDSGGAVYGVTGAGGANGAGAVYKLKRNANGTWAEIILYSFGANSTDGTTPQGGVVSDSAGNLYGTTEFGGLNNWGTVYELSPAGGTWNENILHNFNLDGVDGVEPFDGLVFDKSGNLYGTTFDGGAFLGNGNFYHGTAYELSPSGGGVWNETILHSFGAGSDGGAPHGNLIFDSSGNLYGTTEAGGTLKGGTVFEITP